MMLPILIASVLAMAIIFERLYALRRRRVIGPDPVGTVHSWLSHGGMTPARLAELGRMSPLGQILAAGLAGSHSAEEMRTRIEDAGRHVAHQLERYLNTLGTIALISPLLGLLGTVIGIIDVFQAITNHGGGGTVAPELLAGGIAKALVTTAAGIMVAVPAVIFHRYFGGLIDELIIEMESDAIRLVDMVHPVRSSGRRGA